MKTLPLILALALTTPAVAAQKRTTPMAAEPLVEFEMMTWPEVKKAIEGGKTTALVYNGGTEQRGPQNVNGGHTLMGRAIVKAIALKLGNAIAAPVMPFSPNRASAELPGTIGLSTAAFAMINEEVAEQLVLSGFKTVILMGDHGGGQAELKEVAEKLDAKHAGEGKHVYFCDEVYAKANGDFDEYLKTNNYPVSSHAGIPDTSNMLYLGGDKGWVRKELVATALGDPVLPRGQAPDPNVKRINNGISGDGRKSTAELGKRLFNMKVDYAVAQIQKLMGGAPKGD
ncbi:MAG: creatininase family protein [Vicinamibacteria bacterium]